MKIESMITSINKALREISTVFGKHSQEYMNLKLVVKRNIPSVLQVNDPNYPLRISRSKTVMAGFNSPKSRQGLENVYDFIKSNPEEHKDAYNIRNLAQKYDDSWNLSRSRVLSEKERFKAMAMMRMVENHLFVTIDSDMVDEIEDPATKQAVLKMMKNAGLTRDDEDLREDYWNEAVDLFESAIKRQGQDYLNGVKMSQAAQSAAQSTATTRADVDKTDYTKYTGR